MRYVIATSRRWYESLPEMLSRRTGHDFTLVTHEGELTAEWLSDLNPRYVFLPHWSYRVPEGIYSRFECVIFHMTDVPYGRGGSPLQNLISRGHTDTKMSALKCVEQLDAGPVYLKRDLSLEGSASAVFARCVPLIADMIEEIVSTEPTPIAQEGEPVNFARRHPGQSEFAGIESLQGAFDHIRMLDAEGYPHAYFQTEALRFEFERAALDQDAVTATVRITRRQDSE